MRTPAQVAKEIKKLKTMKPKVLRRSMFGADHHAAIDAQVEVLTRKLDADDVYDEFPNRELTGVEEDCAGNVYEAAKEAAEWLHEENDQPAPSVGWKELVK